MRYVIFVSFFYGADAFLIGTTPFLIGSLSLVFCLTFTFFDCHWKLNRLDVLFIGFVTFYFCRILLAYPSLRLDCLLRFICLLFVYLYYKNVEQGKTFFVILFFAGFVQAIWYILQVGGLFSSYNYLFIGTGSFFNSAPLAIFLVLALFAGIFSFPRRDEMSLRILWCIVFFVLFCCIIVIGSRAAWIAFLVGIFCIAIGEKHYILKLKSCLFFKSPIILKCIYLCVLIGVVVVCFYGLYEIRPISAQGRIFIWNVILHELSDSIFLGTRTA